MKSVNHDNFIVCQVPGNTWRYMQEAYYALGSYGLNFDFEYPLIGYNNVSDPYVLTINPSALKTTSTIYSLLYAMSSNFNDNASLSVEADGGSPSQSYGPNGISNSKVSAKIFLCPIELGELPYYYWGNTYLPIVTNWESHNKKCHLDGYNEFFAQYDIPVTWPWESSAIDKTNGTTMNIVEEENCPIWSLISNTLVKPIHKIFFFKYPIPEPVTNIERLAYYCVNNGRDYRTGQDYKINGYAYLPGDVVNAPIYGEPYLYHYHYYQCKVGYTSTSYKMEIDWATHWDIITQDCYDFCQNPSDYVVWEQYDDEAMPKNNKIGAYLLLEDFNPSGEISWLVTLNGYDRFARRINTLHDLSIYRPFRAYNREKFDKIYGINTL